VRVLGETDLVVLFLAMRHLRWSDTVRCGVQLSESVFNIRWQKQRLQWDGRVQVLESRSNHRRWLPGPRFLGPVKPRTQTGGIRIATFRISPLKRASRQLAVADEKPTFRYRSHESTRLSRIETSLELHIGLFCPLYAQSASRSIGYFRGR
jgi:hypothetical protein